MSTPTFKPEQAKAQAPQEGSSESAGSAKSPKSNASQAQAAEAARASSAGSGNGNGNGGGAASGDAGNNGKSQHVVKAGDTLWAIAKRYKTPGMSMNAAMAAIYEANRKAFKDNMDRLKVDQVLELPELKPAAASAPAVSTAVPVAPAAPAIDNDQQTVQLPSTSDSEPAPEVPKALALAPAAPPEVAPKVDANAEQARALAAGTVDLDPEAALVDATKSEQDTDDAVAEDGKGTHDAPSGTRIFPIDASEVLTVAHLNSVMSSLVNKRGESIIFRLEFSGKVNLGVSVGGKVALELGYAITDSNFVAVYVLSEWAVKLGLSLGGFVNATGEGGMSDAWVRMWFDNHAEAAAYLIDWFRSSKLSEFVKFEEKDPEEKPEKGAAYGVSESAETYGAEISAEVAGAGKVAGEYKNQTIHRTFTARDQTAGQDSYESIEDHQIQKYTLDLAAVGAKGTYSNDRSEISGSPIYYYNGVFCDHALEIDVPKVGDKINAVIEAAFNAVTGLTSMSWGSRVTPEILAKVGTESTKARKNGMGLKVSFTWQEYGEPNAALGLTYFRVNVTPYVEAGGTAKGQIAEVTASAKLSTTQVLHESVSAETVSYIQRQFVYSSVDRPWEAFKAENEASIRALVANCADPTFQYYVPAVDKAFHAAEGENFAAGLAALEAHWSGEHEQVKSIQPDASNIAAEVRKTEGIGIQKVLPNTPTAAQLFQSANRIVAMLKKHENDDDHLAFLFERLNHFNTNWVVLERLMRQNGHGDYYHGLLQRARATGRLKIAEDNVEFHRAGDALHWLYEECVAAPDTAFDKVKSYLTDHAEDKAAREAVRTNTMLMDNVVRNFPDEQRSVIETLIIHGTLEVGPAVQVRLAAAGGKGDEVVRLLGELPRETLVLLETDTVFRTSLSKLPPVDIDGRLMTPGAYFLHKLGRSTSTDPGVARRGNEGFAGDLEIFAGKSEEEIRSSEEFQAWQKESDAAIAEAVKALDKQFDVWTYVSDANVLAILRAYETRTAKIAPFYRLQGLSAGRMLDDAYSAATGRGLRADIGKGLDIGNQKEAERLIGLTALQGATAGGLAEGRLSVGQALTQVVVADRTLAQSVQLTAERLKEELESMFGASDTTVLRLWRQLCTDFRTAGARKEGQPGNFEKLTGVDISTPEAADGLARSLLKSAYLEIGGDLAAAAAKGLSKRELENVRGPLALGAVEGAAQDGHDATAAKVFSALTGFDVDETGKSELSALGALISEACAKEGFTEFYRQKYGIDVFRHAGLIARAIGDESMWNDGLDIAEKMFPGGVPPETRAAAEKPASASTDEIVIPPGAAVDHGFTVQEAEQAAADMWQALMAGDVPAIERRVLKYSADEQKVVNACFRRLSGGIDWQFYAHQAMELQRDGDREHELTIGVEGTDAKVRTPDGEVSARDLGRGWFGGRDVEVDVHNADLRAAIENAETGTVSPQTRIRRHLAEGEIEIIFDVCDQLTDQQRQAVFADKAFMGELHAGLDNEMAWKRVYKVLSGQADLTDRLESRSDGSYGFWRFMEFSDADGMEKDLRAYIKDLKSRQIRALLAANPELSPQEADQQASRWVREQAIQLYNNRDVRAIIESELGPGLDQAKLDGTLLGGGEEDEVLYALQIGAWQHDETALVESIRRMSPEKRQQVLADPVYMANLSAILDDKDDYRDAMLALKSQAQPGDDDHLGALDRASRTSADVGFDWSVEEGDIMANLEQLTHEEHKRLAADPRLRAQILTALKDSPEDYRRARRILGFDGANVPGAGTEDVQYLVFNAATRLEGAAERDWDALLSAAVYVYKMEFKAQGSAEEEGAPAAAPATDADAMARSLRESVWKQAFAAIKRRCDKEGDATQSADARLELIRQAVFKENDPTMARIQANTGASWYGGDVTSSIEDAIKSASDDFIVSNWTTVFQPAPGAGAGQTLAQSYQRFVAARAKQESDPEAYRVARLDFLRFNVTFSGQFEKDLLHIAGGFFADRGQEDAMRIRDNSEWNSWVELLNGRINQLDWNAVAAKIGATGEDAALLDNSTRRALIAQAQTDRKVLGARGLQTSNDWHLAEAEQAEVDFEAIEYGRALREGLVAKDENGERGTLTSAQEFEADVQREQLETKVSDYKAQKAKIANLAATVAAVIAAGIIAALLPGPGTVAAAMVYGALVSGGSAAIESLAKESMLGSDYEVTTEGAKNVLTSAMTGAMIMGSTFFSSRVVGALSGKAGEMVRLPETFTKAAPAWWLKAGGVAKYVGSMGAESLEEVFSEGLEGIGQAGLAFLDPAIFTMGWERFSAYASSKAREQLEQIPNSMTQAAAATVLIKLGQSGRGKRPGGQAAAEGVDAAQDAATRQGRKRLGDAVETGLSAVNHGRAAKIRAKVREYFAEDWSETVQEAFIEWVLGQAQQGYVDLDNVGEDLLMNVLQEQREKYISMGVREVHTATRRRELDAKIEKHRSILTEAEIADLRARNEEMIANQELWTGGDVYGADIYENPEYYAAERQRRAELAVAQWQMAAGSLNDQQISAFIALARSQPSMPAFDAILRTNPHTIPEIAALAGATAQATRAESQDTGGASDIAPEASVSEPGAENAVDARTQPEDRGFSEEASVGSVDFELDAGDSPNDVLLKGLDVPADQQESVASALRSKLGDQSGVDWFLGLDMGNRRLARKMLFHEAAPPFDMVDFHARVTIARNGIETATAVTMSPEAARHLAQHIQTFIRMPPVLGADVTEVEGASENTTEAEQRKIARAQARSESQRQWNKFVEILGNPYAAEMVHMQIGPRMNLSDWAGYAEGSELEMPGDYEGPSRREGGLVRTLLQTDAGRQTLGRHKAATFAFNAYRDLDIMFAENPDLSVQDAVAWYRDRYGRAVASFNGPYELPTTPPGLEGPVRSVQELLAEMRKAAFAAQGGIQFEEDNKLGYYSRQLHKTERQEGTHVNKVAGYDDADRAMTFIHEDDHKARGFMSRTANNPEDAARNILGEVLAPLHEMASGYDAENKNGYTEANLRYMLGNRAALREFVQARYDVYSDRGTDTRYPTFDKGQDDPVDLATDKILELGKTGKSKDPVDNIIAIIRDPSGTGMLGGVDKKGAQERLRVAKNLSYVHQEKLRKYGFTDSDIATGALSNGWTDDTAEKIVALMDADPERFSRKTFAAFDRSIVEQLYAANFGDVSELEGAKAGYNELGMEQLVAVNRVPALLEVFKIAELNRLNGEQLAELELRPQIWQTPVGGKPIRMDTLAAMDAAKLRAYGNALAALGPSAAKLSADVLARNAPELKVAESMLKRGVPAELVMAVRGDTLLHLERITATAVDSSDKSLPPEVSRLAESLMPFLSTSRGKLLNDFLVKNGVEPISMDRRLAELDVGEIEPGQDRNELEKDKARAELVGEGFGAEHVNELSGPILFRFWDAYFGNASSGASMEASLVANVRALAEPSDRAAVEALIPQARRLHAIRSLARVGMSRAELEALPPEALATLEKTQQASVEQGASAKHPGNLQEQLQGQLGQEHGDALVTSMHLARDRQTLVAAGVPADVAATVPAELVQKVMQVRRMVALGAEPSVTNTLYQDVMRHPQAMAVRPAIMSAGLETGGMPDDYTIRQDLLAFGVKPDTLATLRPRTVLHLHNARLRNWNAPMVQGVVYGDIKAGLVPGEQVDQAIKELRAVRELDHLEETGVDAAVEPERQVVSTETRLADIDAALKSGQRVYIVPALDGDRYEVFAVDVATGNVEVDDGPPGHETRQSYLLGALNVKGIEIEAGFTEEASVGVQPSGPKDLRLQVKLGEEQKTTDLSTRDEKPVEPEAKKPPSLDSEKMQKAMLRVADKMPAMRQGDVTGPANYNVSGHTVSNVDGSFWWRPGQTNIAVAPPGDSRVLATTLAQDCSIVIATYADGTRAMMHVHGGERGSSRATDDFRRAIADLNSLGQPAEVLVVYAADGRHAAAIPDIERLVASETGSAKVTSINKGTSEINARAISYVDDQGQASYAAEGLTFEGESTFFQAGTMADKAGPARPDLTASKAADAKTATVQSSAQTPEKASIDDAVFSELIGRYLDGPAMTAPELVAWWSRLNPAQKQLATTHPQLSRMLLGDELPRLVKEGHQAELSGMIAEIQGGRSQAQDQRLQVKTGESEAAADEKPKQTKDFSAEVIAWWEKLPSDFDKRAAKKILWHDAAPAFDPEHYQGVLIPLARGGVPIDALVKLDRGAALYLRQHLFTLQATRPILGGQVQDVDAGEGAKAAEAAKRRSARNESQHIWNEFVAMVADDSVVAAIHAGLGPDMGLADWIGQRGEDGKRGRGMIHTLQDKEAGQNFLAEHKRSTFARQALLEVKEAYHADPQLSVERALEVYRNHYQRGVDNFKKYEVSPQAPGIEGLKPDSVDKLIKKIEASLWGVEGGVSDPFSPMGAYARSGNKATDRANMVGMLKDPSESDEARARGFVHEADHVIRGFNTEEAHSSARVAANILGEVLAPLAEAASGYESDSKVTADSILADEVIDREKVRSFAQIVFDNYSQYFPEQFREFEGETHPVDLVADKIIEISQSGQGSPRDNLLFALQNPSAVGMLGAQDPEWALGKAHSAHRVQSGKVLGLEREQRMRQHGFSEMHIQASVTLQGWTAMTADQSMALVEDGRTPSELLAMTPEQIAQAFEARDGGKVDVAPVDSQRGAVVALPEGARLETWGSTQVVVGDTEVMGVKATRVLPIAGHSDLNDAAMRLGSTRLVHVSGITNKAFYLQEESVYGISPASKDAGVLTAADAKNVETLAGRAAANVRAQLDLGDGKSDFSRLLEQSIGATQLRTDAETQETLPQEAVPLSQQAEEARAKYEALKSDRKASPLQRYDARQEADRLGKELEQQQIEEEREKHRQLGASVLDEVIANTEARRAAGELQETERESEPARWSMPMPHDDETPAFEALLSAPTVGALVHAKRGSKWMPGTLLGPDPANADNVLVRFAKGEGSEDVSVAIASVALTKAQKGAVMEQHQGEGAKILEDLLANPQPTREQKSADQTAKEYVDAVAHDAVYRTSDILAKEKEVQAIESELGFPAYLDSQKWADSKRELENLKYSVAPLDAREREKFEALREIDPKTTELSSAEKAYIKSLEDLLGKKKLFHKQDADLRALVEEVKAYPEKNKAAAKSQARRKLQQQQGSSDFRYYRLPHSSTEIAAAFPRARRGEFDVIETLFKTDPDYVEDELWMKVNLFDSWNGKGKLPEDAKALEVRKLVGERLDLYFQARGRGRSLISTSLDAKPAVEPDGPKDLRLSVKLGEEAGPVDLLTAETATAEQQQGAKTRSKEEVAHIRKLTADAFQEYRQAIRDAKDATGEVKSRENLRHIRRIVSSIEGNRASLEGVNVDVDILICGIVLSDIGKTGAALMKTVEIMREQGVDMEENAFFKAFLGHENYGIAMVQERGASYGLNEAEVEAVVAAIRNHNGPGLRHSWWGKTYKQMLGERYGMPEGKEGVTHTILDRVDQGRIVRTEKADGSVKLGGGVVKILHDEAATGKPLGAVVDNVIVNNPKVTKKQIEALRRWYAAVHNDAEVDAIFDTDFIKGQIAQVDDAIKMAARVTYDSVEATTVRVDGVEVDNVNDLLAQLAKDPPAEAAAAQAAIESEGEAKESEALADPLSAEAKKSNPAITLNPIAKMRLGKEGMASARRPARCQEPHGGIGTRSSSLRARALLQDASAAQEERLAQADLSALGRGVELPRPQSGSYLQDRRSHRSQSASRQGAVRAQDRTDDVAPLRRARRPRSGASHRRTARSADVLCRAASAAQGARSDGAGPRCARRPQALDSRLQCSEAHRGLVQGDLGREQALGPGGRSALSTDLRGGRRCLQREQVGVALGRGLSVLAGPHRQQARAWSRSGNSRGSGESFQADSRLALLDVRWPGSAR